MATEVESMVQAVRAVAAATSPFPSIGGAPADRARGDVKHQNANNPTTLPTQAVDTKHSSEATVHTWGTAPSDN